MFYRLSRFAFAVSVLALGGAVLLGNGVQAGECGPDQNELGNLSAVSFSAAAPDTNGISTLSLTYELAAGTGETLPQTTLGVFHNDVLIVTFAVVGLNGTTDGCGGVGGWSPDCGGKCKTKACNNNNGVCDCKVTPSGQYSKCKCIAIFSAVFGVIANSSDEIRIELDSAGDFAEDDECDNSLVATVP